MPVKSRPKRKYRTTHVRAYPKDRDHMLQVKDATGMGQAAQIEEMIQLKKHAIKIGMLPFGTIKGTVSATNPEEKPYKTAFGHTHDFSMGDACAGCGMTQAEVDWEAEDMTKRKAPSKRGGNQRKGSPEGDSSPNIGK